LSSLLALFQIRRTLQFQLRISIQKKTHDRQVAEDAELDAFVLVQLRKAS